MFKILELDSEVFSLPAGFGRANAIRSAATVIVVALECDTNTVIQNSESLFKEFSLAQVFDFLKDITQFPESVEKKLVLTI